MTEQRERNLSLTSMPMVVALPVASDVCMTNLLVSNRVASPQRSAQMKLGLLIPSPHFTAACVLDGAGAVVEEGRVATTAAAFRRRFSTVPRARVALEAGAHAHWISRLLAEAGHEVIVANPRRLRLIYENDKKSDRVDAESLARVARLDATLLAPVRHRESASQAALALLRARDTLVRARTQLVNHVRGTVKVCWDPIATMFDPELREARDAWVAGGTLTASHADPRDNRPA
jgi:transposase